MTPHGAGFTRGDVRRGLQTARREGRWPTFFAVAMVQAAFTAGAVARVGGAAAEPPGGTAAGAVWSGAHVGVGALIAADEVERLRVGVAGGEVVVSDGSVARLARRSRRGGDGDVGQGSLGLRGRTGPFGRRHQARDRARSSAGVGAVGRGGRVEAAAGRG